MNVKMSPMQSDSDFSKILFLGKSIKMKPICRDKIWLPITKLLSNTFEINNGAQNLTQATSMDAETGCKRLDLKTNNSSTIDCNGLSCFSCQFTKKRLIFTLKGLCPEMHDTQYFLAQENVLVNKIVLSGVKGLTNIVYESPIEHLTN